MIGAPNLNRESQGSSLGILPLFFLIVLALVPPSHHYRSELIILQKLSAQLYALQPNMLMEVISSPMKKRPITAAGSRGPGDIRESAGPDPPRIDDDEVSLHHSAPNCQLLPLVRSGGTTLCFSVSGIRAGLFQLRPMSRLKQRFF